MGTAPNTLSTLSDIKVEVLKQFKQWGEQDWPSVPGKGEPRFIIPAEATARLQCEHARRHGRLTWAHILLEEVAEVCGAESPEHMIEELVQVAAVAVTWIDSIQRNELG